MQGTQNGQKRLAALISDNVLLKWSQTEALLILGPFKRLLCLKCPKFSITLHTSIPYQKREDKDEHGGKLNCGQWRQNILH